MFACIVWFFYGILSYVRGNIVVCSHIMVFFMPNKFCFVGLCHLEVHLGNMFPPHCRLQAASSRRSTLLSLAPQSLAPADTGMVSHWLIAVGSSVNSKLL